MGNCATKPKVLKDTDEDLIPVVKSLNDAPSAADEVEASAARRCEKGKEILIEDDVEEEHSKRQSLSLLFHEDKALEKERTNLSRNKSGASSEASKLDTSALVASNVKASATFDVQTRNDLEVKTPETPKAKEAEEKEVNFSENWEVKFPEELEGAKTSEVVKVSAPELSEVKVTKEPYVPEVLEDKNVPEVSEVPAPHELSEVKVTTESGVLVALEDKNVTEVPKVMTGEVKAAESELIKVSEVTTSEDLDIAVPKVFEVKTPETLSIGSKIKTTEEIKVSELGL
ncbi:unnamed protein product [Eruca vesicaria subsp. sativa]|uniref:Uncharacterized protein n=1 Tax=Eruca vesicaria subsp. sativa TaxID=29727 RepID=A0ABC8KDC5_ERUVS|nr:unnamed protein product [Eruca vesicaria subsp. sativa]